MTTADAMLADYADRLERLLDEADSTREDLKAVKEEAKGNGFNPVALVALVQLRRDEKKRARETEKINDLALYADKLGVQLSLALPVAEPIAAPIKKLARTLREHGATISVAPSTERRTENVSAAPAAEDLAGDAVEGMRRLRAEAGA